MSLRPNAARALLPLLLFMPGAVPAPAQNLPSPREIIDRHIAAIGGEAALRSNASWKATGSFSVPASGLTGTLEAFQAPDRLFARITVPGIGELLRGFDGSVGWSMNPLEGPRVLEGKELAQMREEASRGAALRDTSVVASLETVERTTMNEQECWKVKVSWKSGRETFDCYSTSTGLLIATMGRATTPMGEIEYTTNVHDYKAFGSIKVATRVIQRSLGQEQIVTTESITFGPVDPAHFALPKEIRAIAR